MSAQRQAKTNGPAPVTTASGGGQFLRRKCNCFGSSSFSGLCEECSRKKLSVRSKAVGEAAPFSVPPVVREVLNSPGQPLDPQTLALMESRFGHDFSRVRVHAEASAAESAQAINALAYTVGSRIVFAGGKYAPLMVEGRRLLAHELAHVIQQSRNMPAHPSLEMSPPDGRAEVEADRAATLIDSGSSPRQFLDTGRTGLQRKPLGEDPIHAPLIEEYRRRHGLPPGGVDEFGNQVGPTDAEIKYSLLPLEGLPTCPEVQDLESKGDVRDPEFRKAFIDINCLSSASQATPPGCQFSRGQEKFLESAQQEAARRVQRGLGRIGVGAEGQSYARELAGQLFNGEPPTVKEVVEMLSRVRDFLKGSRIDFAGRTCGDTACQSGAVAYVTGAGQLPIYICPTAFSMPDKLHRTVLHEALHWSGLDADPATPEGYCDKFDCLTPCLDKEVADAWTHYLDCLGQPLEMRRSFREKILESVHEIP